MEMYMCIARKRQNMIAGDIKIEMTDRGGREMENNTKCEKVLHLGDLGEG